MGTNGQDAAAALSPDVCQHCSGLAWQKREADDMLTALECSVLGGERGS